MYYPGIENFSTGVVSTDGPLMSMKEWVRRVDEILASGPPDADRKNIEALTWQWTCRQNTELLGNETEEQIAMWR